MPVIFVFYTLYQWQPQSPQSADPEATTACLQTGIPKDSRVYKRSNSETS